MSVMSDLDLQLQELHEIMSEDQPVDLVGPQLRAAFASLDELNQLALKGHLDSEAPTVGRLLTMAQLLASFVQDRQPDRALGRLRVVRT